MEKSKKLIILIITMVLVFSIAGCQGIHQTKSETIYRGDLVLGRFDTIGRGNLGSWIIKEKDEQKFNEWAKSNEYYVATVALHIATGDNFDYLNGVEYHFYFKDHRWYYLGKFDEGYLFLDGTNVNMHYGNNTITLNSPLFMDTKDVCPDEKIKCEYDWSAIKTLYKDFYVEEDKKQVRIDAGTVDSRGDLHTLIMTYYDDGYVSFEEKF